MHVGTLSESFLRQTELLPKLADIPPKDFAVQLCHAPQVWRKLASTNIDYDTIYGRENWLDGTATGSLEIEAFWAMDQRSARNKRRIHNQFA